MNNLLSTRVLVKTTETTDGADDEVKLPWHTDIAQLKSCALVREIYAVVVIVKPHEIAVDEASDRNRAKLDEAKKEEKAQF